MGVAVRLTVRRRDRVWALLGLLSVVYWIGIWAATQQEMAEATAGGVNAILATIHANGFVLEATYAWVMGALAVHALLAALAWWRGDREVVAGVGISLALHVGCWLWTGVIAG